MFCTAPSKVGEEVLESESSGDEDKVVFNGDDRHGTVMSPPPPLPTTTTTSIMVFQNGCSLLQWDAVPVGGDSELFEDASGDRRTCVSQIWS